MMTLTRLIFAAGMAMAVACTPEPPTGPAPAIEDTTFASSLNITLSSMTKTTNGVYFQDLTPGTGAAAASGSHLTVRYTGYFTNGTSFDTNIGSGKTALEFTLGSSQVIKGWDEGLVGLKVGGTRRLIIPPALGYGSGQYQNIPPNSILVFTVQLVSIP